MATYVNDLRLTELATGEGSGTWGVTTNTNLELIGEALGYGTQDCFATDADATTTVADGASDPARAMYFKVTSTATLTATRTLTIGPNTVSRVMLIENATTGSQSIAISQGSGGNVTIANGAVKMVYLDGAGAGAAVVDAMASLELGTITVANLTATTADINGGTIDGATIGGASAAAGTFTTLQADTSLNVDGTVTADGLTVEGSSSGTLNNVNFLNTDSGATTTANRIGLGITNSVGAAYTYIEANEGGIDAYPHLNFYTGSSATKRLEIEDNGDVSFYDSAGSSQSLFWDASAEALGIGTTSPSAILTVDGGTAAFGSSGITLKRTGTVTGSSDFILAGTSGSEALSVRVNASEKMRIDSSGNVGIGTSSPSALLDVYSTSEGEVARFRGSDGARLLKITSFNAGSIGSGYDFNANSSNGALSFSTADVERMRIDSSGNVGIRTDSPEAQLHIYQPSGQTGLYVTRTPTIAGGPAIGLTADSTKARIYGYGDSLSFWVAASGGTASERARIDSSGNLLVSKTTTGIGTVGHQIQANGVAQHVVDGGECLQLNRLTSDGVIAQFRKDGTVVGSIGSVAGARLYIGTQDTGLEFDASNAITPINTNTGVATDGATTLGASSRRFLDLYLSGGVYLGGTGAANLLDDYEEGTWTPSVAAGSISGTSITYTAKYVKVGDMVTFTFHANSTTGDIQVSSYVTFGGLPFTLSNNATSTVVTEDIDIFARQGFATAAGTGLSLSACGSSSGTNDLFVSVTGKISA